LYGIIRLPDIPGQIFIQVLLSAPLLVIGGVLLFFTYKKRIIGCAFFIVGIGWFATMLYETITK
jgi:Na+/phosphate symporter